MTAKDVLIYPDKRLREPSDLVDVDSEYFVILCQDLKDTLEKYNAHGVAAPQIGEKVRVFAQKCNDEAKIFANPMLVFEGEKIEGKEGCLSFPNVEGLIPRYEEVTVKAIDEEGNEVEYHLDDVEAVAAQHELDHLDGVLFIDRVSNLKKRMMLKKLDKWKRLAKKQGKF